MEFRTSAQAFTAMVALGAVAATALAQGESGARTTIDPDGTIRVTELVVPPSEFLSPEGRAYLIEHVFALRQPQTEIDGVPSLLVPYIDRQRELFAVDREDVQIAGVHAWVYTPTDGVARANRDRVLINLHGGGFSGCWPACAQLESMPIAALGKIRVISLDYRHAPEHRRPAASEDVAAVYQALLNDYRPENMGIYGCSAGGMLTGMSVAWLLEHGLPLARCRWHSVRRFGGRGVDLRRRRQLHGDPARRRTRRSAPAGAGQGA